MTIGVQTFRGERLKEARLSRGLFKKALGDLVGVTGTAITRYEEGDDKPQRERLEMLASKLGFPVEFFLHGGWSEKIDTVFWRSRVNETKSAREMTEQRMRWLCEIFHLLEQEVDFPKLDLPNLDLPADFRFLTPEAIERAAEDVRHHWGLRFGPIPDVILALENAGIPVVTLEIESDKQDGFFFASPMLGRSFVGINTYQVSCVRARFDAAHELGHAILHANVRSERTRDLATHKIMEQQAHRFASAFLFPRSAFLGEVAVPSLDYFCALKKRWGISIAAMAYRAYNLGIIDDAERAALFQNMGRRRWRGPLREPFDDASEMPLEKPRMLRRAIEAVVGAGIFGRATLVATLGLPAAEVEQIAGLERGFLEERQATIIQLTPHKDRGTLRTTDLESGKVVEFPGRQ